MHIHIHTYITHINVECVCIYIYIYIYIYIDAHDCSPWGLKDWMTKQQYTHTHTHTHIFIYTLHRFDINFCSYSNAYVGLFSLVLSTEYVLKLPDFSSVHFYFLFWSCHMACGILVPWPGIEPVFPAREVWSLNNWTARSLIFHFQWFIFYL